MAPYDSIAEVIKDWCEKNSYTDFLVTIGINDDEITEYLAFDPAHIDFVWENDWWEGEADVRLLGFLPIGNISVYGSPLENVGYFLHLPEDLPEVGQQ